MASSDFEEIRSAWADVRSAPVERAELDALESLLEWAFPDGVDHSYVGANSEGGADAFVYKPGTATPQAGIGADVTGAQDSLRLIVFPVSPERLASMEIQFSSVLAGPDAGQRKRTWTFEFTCGRSIKIVGLEPTPDGAPDRAEELARALATNCGVRIADGTS